MSLINEALKKARVDAAAEQSGAGPRMDLHAVVAADTRRGGVKVTSLLLTTVIVLAVSVLAILLVGGSAKPRAAGASEGHGTNEIAGVDGADGLGIRSNRVAGVEPRDANVDVKVDANEKIGEIGTTIALADVGKDAAAARSVEPAVKDVAVPAANDSVKPTKEATLPVVSPVAVPVAVPVQTPTVSQTNEQTAALVAAVVRALEADRAKQAKANEANEAKETEAKEHEQQPVESHPKQDKPAKPVEPVAVASPFPTFTGEVDDERFPYLKISGVSRSNDQQCVLINKKILLLGDTIENVIVERIERKRVRLKYNGQVFFLALP